MEQAVFAFELEGTPVSCERYGMGHINRTYLVVTDAPRRYILQRLSRAAFHDIPGLMENVRAVTEYLARQTDDPRAGLHLIPTRDGAVWHQDADGEYWRMYDFVEDSLCLQAPETPEDFYQSAVAFGSFQRLLRDFPTATGSSRRRSGPIRSAARPGWGRRSPLCSPAARRREPCSGCARREKSPCA